MFSTHTIIAIAISMYAVAAMTSTLLTRFVISRQVPSLSQDEKNALLATPAAKGLTGPQIGSFVLAIIILITGGLALVGQIGAASAIESGTGTSGLSSPFFGLEILSLFALVVVSFITAITNAFWIYSKKTHLAEQVAIATGQATARLYRQHITSWIVWIIAAGFIIYLAYNSAQQDIYYNNLLSSL